MMNKNVEELSIQKRFVSKKLSLLLVTSTIAISQLAPVSPAQSAQEACPFPDDEAPVIVEERGLIWCGKAFAGFDAFLLPQLILLATENLATNELTLGSVDFDRELTGHSVGFDVEALQVLGTQGIYQTGIIYRYGLEFTEASGNQLIDQFDPGTGYGLGIPGSDGGASGVFLGLNPNNIVENLHYDGDLRWSGSFFNVERRFEAEDHAFGVYAGGSFSILDLDESITGEISGYSSDFTYNTELQTRAYGAHLGARGRRDIGQPINGVWQPQASFRAELGLAYVNATLNDHTAFGGFIGGIVPDSQIEVKDSGWDGYGSVGGAFSLTNKKNNLQLFLDAQYEYRPWFGSAYRDGTNPTQLQRAHADVFSGRLGLRLQF